MTKKEQKLLSESIISMCKSEEQLIYTVNKISKTIESLLKKDGVTEQERIRDTIRSEAFAAEFREKIR